MVHALTLGDLTVDVIRKDIKNIHLSVHPPTGRVRLAAPRELGIDAVRAYAISKIAWIRKNQKRLAAQPRETPRDYIDRESHFVWGDRVLMQVRSTDGAQQVHLEHRTLTLTVRDSATQDDKHRLIEAWYRDELRTAAMPLVIRWEELLAVKSSGLFIQRMKTKWGACNPVSGNLRLNTELAKKPRECLNYVILHELIHLIERSHSEQFYTLLDRSLPHWREVQRLLNSLPLSTRQSPFVK